MNNEFLEVIEGLSRLMNLPLTPEHEKSIVLAVDKKLRVQLELEEQKNRLIVASQIFPLDPGKFRENVLLYALMTNVYPYTLIGTLCFSEKTGSLVLYHYFDMEKVSPDVLHDFLPRFVEKAMEWQEALENSNPAPAQVVQRGKKHGISPFGIRP